MWFWVFIVPAVLSLTGLVFGWRSIVRSNGRNYGYGDYLFDTTGGAVFGVFGILSILPGFVFGVSWLDVENLGGPECPADPVPLRALASATDLHGEIYVSIFGGYGSVDTSPSFSFLAVNPDGSFYRDERSASNTVIREVSGAPVLKCIDISTPYDARFIAPWIHDKQTWSVLWEFDVPVGSVSSDISVTP